MKTILVVEDYVPFARPLCLFLKRNGYRVLHAADGRQAMALLEGPQPGGDNVRAGEAHAHAGGGNSNGGGDGSSNNAGSGEPRVDLVLLDMAMPEMDGRAFLTRLRRDPKLRPTPVVVMTAMADRDLAAGRAEPLDVQGRLLKSRVTLAEVLARVKAVLAEARASAAAAALPSPASSTYAHAS